MVNKGFYPTLSKGHTVFFLVFVFLFIASVSFAQKNTEVKIKTTAECEMCKKSIETTVYKIKGVKKVTVDITTKEATVIYNPNKTSVEEIKKAIVALGYDADDMKANVKAYKALPDCCKKGEAHEHKPEEK